MRLRINLLPDHQRIPSQFLTMLLLNKVIFALLVLACILAASGAMAADIRPVGSLDAQATGAVTPARTLPAGQVAVGVSVQSIATPAAKHLQSNAGREAAAERISHSSLVLGIGLSENFSLNIGAHGVQESMNATQRVALGSGTAAEEKSAQFSGASLLAKWSAYRNGAFELAVAPFVESGAGKNADNSLARSSGVKGGWMLLAGWADRGVGALDINLGYRYRNPEAIGDVVLRNEMLAQASAKAYLIGSFGVMASAAGRRVMVAADRGDELVGKKYLPVETGEIHAGLVWDREAVSLSAYMGKNIKGAGLGNGDRHVGAGLSYVIGGESSGKSAPAKKDPVSEQASTVNAKPQPVAKDPNAIYDLEGNAIDPFQDFDQQFGEPEDFKSVRENIRRNEERMQQSPISEDVRVENELRAIKAAEAKREAAKKAEEEAAAEARRSRSRAEREAQAEEMRRLQEEVKNDVQKIKSITDEDLRWEGLEEIE